MWNYKYSALYPFLKKEFDYKPIKCKKKILKIKIKQTKPSPLKYEIK